MGIFAVLSTDVTLHSWDDTVLPAIFSPASLGVVALKIETVISDTVFWRRRRRCREVDDASVVRARERRVGVRVPGKVRNGVRRHDERRDGEDAQQGCTDERQRRCDSEVDGLHLYLLPTFFSTRNKLIAHDSFPRSICLGFPTILSANLPIALLQKKNIKIKQMWESLEKCQQLNDIKYRSQRPSKTINKNKKKDFTQKMNRQT
jgi:hypothetical protein